MQRVARRVAVAVFCAVMALTFGGSAQPIDRKAIPPDLEKWTDWVLDELGEEACPAIGTSAVCLWPGRLTVKVQGSGGEFRYEVQADRTTRAQLPGSADFWPQDVKIGAKAAVVDSTGDHPTVLVPAGKSVLTGKFLWQSPPDSLDIPVRCAIVRVEADGKAVDFPRREGATLWLEGLEVEAAPEPDAGPAEEIPDSLDLDVNRLLKDGSPMLATTRLTLRVAGKPREVQLGNVLVPGSQLLGAQSDTLPVRVDAGTLVAQVRPGTHDIVVTGAFATPPEAIAVPKPPKPWPQLENWAWQPDPDLRQVEISGVGAIDPSRTTLPPEWRGGRAYQVAPGSKLTLKTTRRGETEAAPNEIVLRRQMWLALDGSHWTVRDHFSGIMSRDFRLNLLKGELGRFASRDQDFLLTHDPDGGVSGVEVRRQRLDLVAEWVLPSRNAIPAVGWSQDVQELEIELNTPPGWEVVSVTGVDDFWSPTFSRLSLPMLIGIALIAFAIGRLGKPWWGVVAAVALIFATRSFVPEPPPLGPWLVLVAAIAGLRYAPWRWARPPLWLVATIAMLVAGTQVVAYAAELTTMVLFPADGLLAWSEAEQEEKETEQVAEENADNKEGGTGTRAKGEEGSMGTPSSKATNKRYAIQGPKDNDDYGGAQMFPRPEEEVDEVAKAPEPPKDIVLQMGPGVPDYHAREWNLPIDGPVKRDHEIRIRMISPALNALLGLLQVGLLLGLLALGLRLLRDAVRRDAGQGDGEGGAKGGAQVAAAAALLATLAVPSVARAQMPNRDLLDDLRARLTRQSDCDACVSVSRMNLKLDGPTIATRAEVHVTGTRAYELPGPVDAWVPTEVKVDGQATTAIVLEGESLYVRLGPGKHLVEAKGEVAKASLTFSLGTTPRRVDVEAKGWRAEGLGANGVPKGALALTRTVAPAEEEPVGGPQTKPQEEPSQDVGGWLVVERFFTLGNKWTVRTRISRVGPGAGAITAEYPVVQGERFTDPTVVVRNGKVRLALKRGESAKDVSSSLEIADALALRAVKGGRLNERWTFSCSEIWRCSFAGITPTSTASGDALAPSFRPWPGEQLSAKFSKPEAAPGSSLTIDAAKLSLSPGPRSLEARLVLPIRASKAQQLIVTLPEGAELTSLTKMEQDVPIEMAGRDVTLHVEPGGNPIAMKWKQQTKMGFVFRAPEVKLSAGAANAEVEIDVPHQRRMVWFSGPYWGPGIETWIGWLALLLVAVVLGTLPRSPLPIWQWAVLGFGFIGSTPWGLLAVVFAWFFMMQARGRSEPVSAIWHNARQVVIGLATLFVGAVVAITAYERLGGATRLDVVGGYSRWGGRSIAWYLDAIDGVLPRPVIVSVPEWVMVGLYAIWAGAVAYLCYKWGNWAWEQYGEDGLWKRRRALAAGAVADGLELAVAEPTATDAPEEAAPAEAAVAPAGDDGAEPEPGDAAEPDEDDDQDAEEGDPEDGGDEDDE